MLDVDVCVYYMYTCATYVPWTLGFLTALALTVNISPVTTQCDVHLHYCSSGSRAVFGTAAVRVLDRHKIGLV